MRKGAYVLGVLATLVPFAFGAIRAITTGSDFRYIWMALAAALGLAAVTVTLRRRAQTQNDILTRSAGVCVLAAVLAAAAGYALGARSSISVWIVALSFGLCEAVGFALATLSRRNGAPVA